MAHNYPSYKLKFWQSKGLGGHLATISDAEVNAFVNSKINDLAGSDPVRVLLVISSHDFESIKFPKFKSIMDIFI